MDTLTALISWTVSGAVIGAIARFLMPGDQNLGCFLTVALGVVGSYVGGFISALLTEGRLDFMRPSGWIMSIIGAIVVLVVAGRIKKKGPPPIDV